ncbi:hypothetical protein ACHAWF_017230 [Thalassiosira exigua]
MVGVSHSTASNDGSSFTPPSKSKSLRNVFSRRNLGSTKAGRSENASYRGGKGATHQGRDPPPGNSVEEKQISSFNDKGNEFFGKGEFDAALRMYSEALKLLKETNIVVETTEGFEYMPVAMRRARTGRCLVNVGAVHIRRDSFDDAISALELAMRQSKLVKSDSKHYFRACEVTADALENIGLVLFKQENYEQSSIKYTDALEARRKCLDLMDANHKKRSRSKSRELEMNFVGEKNASKLELSVTLFYMSLLKEKRGEIEEAVKECEEAVRIRREIIPNPKDDPNTLSLYSTLGRLYCHEDMKGYRQALEYLHEVYRRKCEAVGRDHIDVVPSLNSIAFVYNELGEYDKCVAISDRAIDIATNGRGMNKETCVAYANKGEAHGRLGDWDRAITSFDIALATQSKCLEKNDMLNAEVYEKLSEAYLHSKDMEKAISSLEESIAVKRSALGPDNEEIARSYSKLGEYHERAKEPAKAIKCHTRALRIFKHHDNKEMAATEHNKIASILKSSGESNKAMEHYMAALWHSREARLPSTSPIVADTIKNVASFQKG